MPWTTADVPDQTGRTAVVTGANSGIGYHTALELARRGARVVLAVRDPGRGRAALDRLTAEVPAAAAELGELDLADLASVRAFATAYGPGGLDLLVNNAGVMAVPLGRTADGFETQLGVNHLGHYALTGLLLPRLLARPGARVVTVSSAMHRTGRIDFTDLNAEGGYRKWAAYSQSKLANLLFAQELQRRADGAGADLLSVAAHPGWAATNLQATGPRLSGSRFGERAVGVVNRLVAQSDAQGALPTLRAATDPEIRGGDYVGPSGPFELRGRPRLVAMANAARDRAVARRLWEVSERLTGVRYDFAAPEISPDG
jgi:NAD(P)-dependent dehydrogenase (short-subunit alcohol dehydrogenase family)